MPRVVLWAWERPEDLRFIDSRQVGVAFLAATAEIARDGSVSFTPRMQRLALPDDVAAIAVVRIASPPGHLVPRTDSLLAGLSEIASRQGVRGLQIDFDSRASERAFYENLIESVRHLTSKPISVTALVSWCVGDRWLDREPIGEAVPMFFRMGRTENRNILVESSVCRGAVGLSMDEAWPHARPSSVRRVYLFSPHAWTRETYLAGLRRIQEWK
jgi:hypothetical protein